MSDLTPEQRLDQAIGALPEGITPAQDLWPGIQAQIAPQSMDGGYWALAASWLVTAVGIGFLGMRLWGVPGDQAPATVWPAVGQEYELALEGTRTELHDGMQAALAGLSQQDRIAIASELDGLRAAREEVLTALQQTPQDSLLQRLAVSTAQRELVVMQQITQLSHHVSERTQS